MAEERVTVADVLQKLKEDLAAQQAVLADAQHAVRQLQVAIAAIEKVETQSKSEIKYQRPARRRGQLQRAVIEAMREGIGTVGPIVRHLDLRGIKTTPASVSNVIQRLQRKKQIHTDPRTQRWVLTASSGNGEAAAKANGALSQEF